jgi:hypothetical protein
MWLFPVLHWELEPFTGSVPIISLFQAAKSEDLGSEDWAKSKRSRYEL